MIRSTAVWVVITILVATLGGCTKNNESSTGPGPGTGAVAGPSNLRAYSVDSSRVGLTWALSVDESRPELLNYEVTVNDTAGGIRLTLSAVKGQSSMQVSALQNGVVYDFTIRAIVASGSTTHDSSTVRWSPALRLEFEGSSSPIQVFETADPAHPSGLDLYSSPAGGPVTRFMTVAPGNALIDLYVDTLSGSQDLMIRSASQSTVIPNGRITIFSSDTTNTNDLSTNPRVAPPQSSTFSTLVMRVPAAGASTGKIIWGKTQDGNYFRLLIVYNGTSLISGPSGHRFLTFKISYQSVVGNPYAWRAGTDDSRQSGKG